MPYFESNGHRLFYREGGSGPLLFILPGNTSSSAQLTGELDYFSQWYHCVSLDFCGTGQSDRMERWPVAWWQQGARDALTLYHLMPEPFCMVMGCSGGAWVALWMAIFTNVEHWVTAVVADSQVEFYPPELLRKQADSRDLHDLFAGDIWARAHGYDWREVITRDSELLRDFARYGGHMYSGRLAQITCPVLFTASLSDQMLPDVGPQTLQMVSQVPRSQVFLTQDGDHPLMWSRPNEFRRVAGSFLEAAVEDVNRRNSLDE